MFNRIETTGEKNISWQTNVDVSNR